MFTKGKQFRAGRHYQTEIREPSMRVYIYKMQQKLTYPCRKSFPDMFIGTVKKL